MWPLLLQEARWVSLHGSLRAILQRASDCQASSVSCVHCPLGQSKSQGQAQSPWEKETDMVCILAGRIGWIIALTAYHSPPSMANGPHPSHMQNTLTPSRALKSHPSPPPAHSAGAHDLNPVQGHGRLLTAVPQMAPLDPRTGELKREIISSSFHTQNMVVRQGRENLS